MNFNPWNVSSIDEFSRLNCPECDFRTKENKKFQDHATKNHPLSVVLFCKGTKVITFNSINELNQLKNMSKDTKRKQPDTKVIKFNNRNELNDLKQLSHDQKCTNIVSKYKLPDKIKVSISTVDKSKNILNKDFTEGQKCKDILSKYSLPNKISVSKVDESKNTRSNNFKNRNELNQQLTKIDEKRCKELMLKHRLPDRIEVSRKTIDAYKRNLNGVPDIKNRQQLKRVSKETKYQGQHKILKVHEEKKQGTPTNKPEEENDQNKNPCPICSETFPQKWALEFHITKKHNELPNAAMGKNIASQDKEDKLKRNIETLHNLKTIPHEDQKFEKANSTRIMEKKRKHAVHEITFICSLCNVKVFTKKDLKAHIASVHEGTKPYSCSIRNCDSTFKTKKSLNRHINTIHERKKNFKCQILDTKLVKKIELKNNLAAVHDLSDVIFCEKMFAAKGNLNKGIKKIHDGKTFEANFDIKGLKNTQGAVHEGVKPFKCDLCEKLFATKSNLTLHIKTTHQCTVNLTRL